MTELKSFREKLLNIEPTNTERHLQFQNALDDILEPRLPRSHRWYYALSLVGGIAGMGGSMFGLLFDAENRLMHSFSLVGFVFLCGMSAFTLRRGAEPFQMMQGASKWFVGLSLLAAGILVFWGLQNPSPTAILWSIAGMLLFLLTNFINLWNRVISSERTLREQLLRMEYRFLLLSENETAPQQFERSKESS